MLPASLSPPLIIFDFDGVIVDSESLMSQVLAEGLTAHGFPTTLDDSLTHYLGRNWQACERHFHEHWGTPMPDNLRAAIDLEVELRLPDLQPIGGAVDFVRGRPDQRRCIASSSPPAWIERCLNLVGLRDAFAGAIFSTSVHVQRGKPHPDIYVHAAHAMGVPADQALIIEDSPIGVAAAVAAGAQVIGLCAGSHVGDEHGEKLRAAGAHHICHSFAEVERLLS